MNTVQTLSRNILRACMLALFCTLFTTAAFAQAEECAPGNCHGVKIYNYTDYSFKMQFKLCCDGQVRITDCWEVPSGGTRFYFGEACTLGNWRFCDTLPENVCYVWYPDECVIKIYYCQ